MGPLAGIRVLDLSRVLAGPWAGQCLADFGAEVVKIEKPGSGDDTRTWGPPWLDLPAVDTRQSAYFLSANRGKRAAAIDFTQPEGAHLVRELVKQSDVVLENFKVGGLKKYGLDFESLIALKPSLVVCSITGFGQTGPYAEQPGYDAMIQAQGGIMSLTGVPDGEPGAGPQKVGVAVADLMTGMYAVSAVLAALIHARSTGVGQHIDLALLDTQVAWLANQAMNYLVGGAVPQRLGTAHPNIVPYQSVATADGFIMLAVGNDRQFASLCAAAGHSDVALDARFQSNAARVANRQVLIPMLEAWMRLQSTDSWLATLAAVNVPCGPINDLARVFEHPQVKARGLQIELPSHGVQVPQVANPVRFSKTPIEYRTAPPILGQDTAAVLAEIGVSQQQFDALKLRRVVG
jgi:crotonobetainyl-CoA:carnitine CoA-transferase CaiB-like acyl-CoA transferase